MNDNACNNAVLWSARALGVVFSGILLWFFIAHGIAGELPRVWQESLAFDIELVALVAMMIGGVVGWYSPGLASVVILCAYTTWKLMEQRLPWPPRFIEIPLLIGLLYGFTWLGRKRTSA